MGKIKLNYSTDIIETIAAVRALINTHIKRANESPIRFEKLLMMRIKQIYQLFIFAGANIDVIGSTIFCMYNLSNTLETPCQAVRYYEISPSIINF